jgi:tyramine---L-glutamate ligase
LKIIIYEHVSGGGYASQELQSSILAEGFSILRTVASDFKASGHKVTVLLDARISLLNPPLNVDCQIPVFPSQDPKLLLQNIAKINDAIYIIAPETGQVLQSLVKIINQTGKISLNSEFEAIKRVSDKTVLYNILQKNSIPIPQTLTFEINVNLSEVKKAIKSKFGYPAIFKPIDGVSCGGLSLVKEDSQVEKAILKIRTESSGKNFVAQEFIRGKSVSVSLLVAAGKAYSVSLNSQNVTIALSNDVSSYEGGVVPFDHPLKQEAFKAAEKIAVVFSGLKGYVGVDLVLSNYKPFVVDVNSRLTTSYVGLSKTAKFNVAQAMLEVVLKGQASIKTGNNGFACFSKVVTSKPSINAFQEATKVNQIISPPFPLNSESKACSLVTGYGNSLEIAQLEFEEAKKRLFDIVNRGK